MHFNPLWAFLCSFFFEKSRLGGITFGSALQGNCRSTQESLLLSSLFWQHCWRMASHDASQKLKFIFIGCSRSTAPQVYWSILESPKNVLYTICFEGKEIHYSFVLSGGKKCLLFPSLNAPSKSVGKKAEVSFVTVCFLFLQTCCPNQHAVLCQCSPLSAWQTTVVKIRGFCVPPSPSSLRFYSTPLSSGHVPASLGVLI